MAKYVKTHCKTVRVKGSLVRKTVNGYSRKK